MSDFRVKKKIMQFMASIERKKGVKYFKLEKKLEHND
jgi:hypothetical protein